MKICKRCNENKVKNDFYKHKEMKDGHLSICKLCTKKRINSHRKNNIEKIRSYDRSRGDLPHRVLARKKYSKTEAYKFSQYIANRKWILNNKIKRNASAMVRKAIKKGWLIKKNCEVCDNPKSQGHHEDYSNPLEVVWLCDKHHKIRHKELRKLSNKVGYLG